MGRTRNNYYIPVANAAFEIYRRWRRSPAANQLPFKYPYGLNFPRSRTLTKTKEEDEEESQMVNSLQTLGSAYINVDTGNAPLKRVVGDYIDYKDGWQFSFSWLSNQMKFFNVLNIGTKAQYTDNTAVATTNRARFAYQNFFGLNVNQGIPAGSFVPPNITPASDWIGIKAGTVHMDFVNETNLPCFVKVHWFKCTNDSGSDPLFVYKESAVNNSFYTTTYTQTGVDYPTVGGNEAVVYDATSESTKPISLTTPIYTNLMSRSRSLTNWWKPLKTHKFNLAGGDTYRLTTNIMCNMFAFRDGLSNADAYLPGSVCAVLEFQGAACHLKKTDVPTYDTYGLAPGKVSVMFTRKLKIAQFKATASRFDMGYVAPSNLLVGGTVANTVLIGDIDIGVDGGTEA